MDFESTIPREPHRLSKAGLRLILQNGDEIEVREGDYIGRVLLAKAFLKIDPSIDPKTISRKHFRIWNEAGTLYVVDEDSQNGTTLNGKEIGGRGSFAIHDGDKIWISPLEQCKMVFRAPAEYGVKIISVEPTKKVFISDVEARLRVVFHNYESMDEVVKLRTNAPGFEKGTYESTWIQTRAGMDLEHDSVLIGRPLKRKVRQLDIILMDESEMCLDSKSFNVEVHESWWAKLRKTGHYALKLIPIVLQT